MPPQAAFGISVAFSFLAWGIVTALYIWPWLSVKPRVEAMRPILVLHSFRFVGLAFIVPGVVSPALPPGFARPDAYGDIVAAILAIIALALLRSRLGLLPVWLFSLWGSVDLLNAFYQGFRHGLAAGELGAAYFLIVLVVPLLLITHGVLFRLLLTKAPTQTGRVER
jgi:hypothetical protein